MKLTVLLFVFTKKCWSAAYVFIAKFATKAITTLAIVAMKLNEGLRVGNDGVVLGFELFPQGKGTIAERLVGLVFAIGKEHRCDTIDDDELDGGR